MVLALYAAPRESVGSCDTGLPGAPHDSAVMDSSRMSTPNKNKIQTLQNDDTILRFWARGVARRTLITGEEGVPRGGGSGSGRQ